MAGRQKAAANRSCDAKQTAFRGICFIYHLSQVVPSPPPEKSKSAAQSGAAPRFRGQINCHFLAALYFAHLALVAAEIAALPAALIFLVFATVLAGASLLFPVLILANLAF